MTKIEKILHHIGRDPKAAAEVIEAALNAFRGGIVNAEDSYCLQVALMDFFDQDETEAL